MEIEEILEEFGRYYINQGQNMTRLIKLLNRPSVTDSILTSHYTDDTVYRAAKARIGRVLQPFQKVWTPLGKAEFKPIKIEQFKMKIDAEEYPDDLEGSWLGFLADSKLDRKEWPLVRYFVEELLLPQAQEDYEMYEVYAGVQQDPQPGVPGAAGTSMNGLRKSINDQVAAGRITPIVLGAIPTDPVDVVDYFEMFADRIDKRYWKIGMQVGVPEDVERLYLRGCEKKYGLVQTYKEMNGNIRYTNHKLVGLPSMDGSDKIWCTTKGNAIKLHKKTQNQKAVKIENVDRLVKMYSDWWSGVGFLIPEIVFTNDQDLV